MSDTHVISNDPTTGNMRRKELSVLETSIPTNLPPLRTSIIGREEEKETICRLLYGGETRLVTLTGFGGSGKTTLAVYTAHTLLEHFSGGVFFIDLSLVTDPALVLSAIAKTLNLPEEPQRDIRETLKDFLLNRSVLFVLDNFEQVVSGAPAIARFLDDNPHVHIIATSREALRLRGEQALPIAPLAGDDAVQMFAQYARTVRPDFHLAQDDIPAVHALCKRLDGLPLAIELAAMRIKIFTPQTLLVRLTSDLEIGSPLLATLTSGPHDLPERQQTLRATIAWSYSLLTETEQRAFRAASIFKGGFSLHTLRQVMGESEADVMEVVASLVDKSLLQSRASEDGESRFTMLNLIREFAEEQVRSAGEERSLQAAFLSWSLSFAQQGAAGLKSNVQAGWLSRLDAEHDNLLHAIEVGLSAGAGSDLWLKGLATLESMHRFWAMSGYFFLMTPFVERGLAQLEAYLGGLKPKERQAKSLLQIRGGVYALSGSLAWYMGQYEKACDYHRAAYEDYKKINDEADMADALNNLAVNLSMLREDQKALACYEQGQALYRKVGDAWGEARLINNMAGTLINFRRLDETWQLYERGIALAREIGDDFFISMFLLNIGDLKFRTGKYQEAVSYLRQSIAISKGINSAYVETWGRVRLAMIQASVGQKDEAISMLLDIYSSRLERFDADLRRIMLEALVSIFMRSGMTEQAAVLFGAWREVSQHFGKFVDPFEEEAMRQLEKEITRQFASEKREAALMRGALMTTAEALEFGMSALGVARNPQTVGGADALFTVRERDVLVLLAQGKTNEEISQELVVVLKTVEKHVANILRKLGVKNRTEAAAWAVENGIK